VGYLQLALASSAGPDLTGQSMWVLISLVIYELFMNGIFFLIWLAPVPSRQYSCMSFQENDNSFHEDDGDQDSSGEVQEQQVESTPVPSEPHRRKVII